MPATLTPPRSAVPIIRIASLTAFLRGLLEDRHSVRHCEVRWTTQAVTQIADQQVLFETLIAGYITERDGHPAIIELHYLCGAIADDRRTEDANTQEQIGVTIQRLEIAAAELGLDLRQGRFTLDPSPLMPTPDEALRTFGPTFTSLGGTTYSPWTDSWGIGFECVRGDGLCTFMYLEPRPEQAGRATVFCYLGSGGDPTEDVVQHAYDPFDPVQLTRTYSVVTETGARHWVADDSGHACRQHEAAFGGESEETIMDVYLTRSEEQANLSRIHIDSAASEAAVLDGMMRLAQRLSSGHPESRWIAVIAALRQMKEAEGA